MTRSHGLEPNFIPRADPILIQGKCEVKNLSRKYSRGTVGPDTPGG